MELSLQRGWGFGDLHQERFETIWGGPRHRQVIQELSARYACGGCHDGCRSHSYNRAIALGRPRMLSDVHKNFF